ncbi:MAG: UDP-N-acetylmuramoyl-tripeptide--D-alanyl-D-alanine ligase, partial [Firmicutes bacterium]|nr:UDP-N-acetylmuramoyl-tripeptide--D-alanyl-D-alanine ligase [Bacillota bacterium]
SVKELTRAVLSTKYVTGASTGNFNTTIGLPLSFFNGLDQMTHFVAEMGLGDPGDIDRLTALAPLDVAVITHIGISHLERMGSQRAIQREKGRILLGLKTHGTAVLNGDDPLVRELGAQAAPHEVLWYGRYDNAAARIEQAELTAHGTAMQFDLLGTKISLVLPWFGVHQAENVAAALLIGRVQGVPVADMVEALEHMPEQAARLQIIQTPYVRLVADYYNANPDSTRAALAVLSVQPGRKIAVLGDMLELGQASESGHRQVGRAARKIADYVVAVGPQARWIAEEVGTSAVWCQTVDEARQWLGSHLALQDAVLLKASHAMHFDRLAEHIKRWEGPA